MKKKPLPQAAPRAFQWRPLVPFVALWALVLVAYSNSFSGGLVFDNAVIIGKDVRLRAFTGENLGLIFGEEYWYRGNGNGLYRPLTTLSYLVNYSVLGEGANPAGYHAVNCALHAVNASLVFLLGLELFGVAAPALAMAAIWAVHPALTESVTNIVGRADLLAAFGVLAALLCFARARAVTGSRRVWWWAGCAAASAIGVFSKESAIIVLGAIPLFDLSFAKPQSRRTRLIGFGAAALPCALFLMARQAVLSHSPGMHIPFTDNPIIGAGFWQGRLTALAVLAREVLLLIFPWRLSADYSYNAIPLVNGFDRQAMAGAAILLGAAELVQLAYRRDRKVLFLALLGLGAWLPTSNLLFPIGTIMAERFLYLPAIAFAGCLAAALWSLRERIGRRAMPIACAALVLLFAARTFARNFDWRTDDTLFQSAEPVVPNSFRVHNALAHGTVENAVREADITMRILNPLPDRWNAISPFIVAGKAYSDMGDTLPPDKARAWYEKSMATLQRGKRINQAVNEMLRQQDLARGAKFQSADWSLLDENIGYVALRTGDYVQAIEALRKALRVRMSPDAFLNLSAAYAAQKDGANAEITLLEGTIWRHQDNAIATRLVAAYRSLDPNSCALSEGAAQSYRLNTTCPLVQSQLCTASTRLLELLDAQQDAAEAARVRTAAQHAGCAATTK